MYKRIIMLAMALASASAFANDYPEKGGGHHAPVKTNKAAAAATSRSSASAGAVAGANAQGGDARATGGTANVNVAPVGGAGGSVGAVAPNQSTVVTTPRAPAATAYAPPVSPTANCALGASVGVQGGVGFSLGSTSIEPNCARIEKMKAALALGDHATAREVMCGDEDYRAARRRTSQPCWADLAANQPKVDEPRDPYVRRRLGLAPLAE